MTIRALGENGRLIYIAQNLGRLGILDAVECGPTFSAEEKVVGSLRRKKCLYESGGRRGGFGRACRQRPG
jgi:hypothetical protein